MRSPVASFLMGIAFMALVWAVVQAASLTLTFGGAIIWAAVSFVAAVCIEVLGRRSTH